MTFASLPPKRPGAIRSSLTPLHRGPGPFPTSSLGPLGCELQAVLTLALPAEWDLWENVPEILRCSVLSFLTSAAPDVPREVMAACS